MDFDAKRIAVQSNLALYTNYPKLAVQVLSFLENKEESIMFKNEQLNW